MSKAIIKTKKKKNGRNKFTKPKAEFKQSRSVKQIAMINQSIKALLTTSSKKDASKILNISEQALFNRLNNYPEIKATIENYKQKTLDLVKNKIVFATEEASNKMINLIEARSENIQLEASKEILDRAGITKPTETNVQVNVLNQIRQDKDKYFK